MAKKLIGTLSVSGMPLGDIGGGSPDAVLFTPQELTTAQKTQARTNIGAVSAAEVNKAVESIDLTPYATKVYVDGEIAAIDIPSLEGYATEQFVRDEIATIPEVDLSNYPTINEVNEKIESAKEVSVGANEPTGEELVWVNPEGGTADKLATENYVNEQIAAIDIPSLEGYATETWVNGQLGSYALKTDIPEIPDVSNFATKDEIPSLEGYATETYVNEKVAAVKVEVPVATTETAGKVKPDGTTITVDEDGTIHSAGGSGGGLDSIVAGSGDSAILFNYKAGENDEQIYGEGETDSQNRGTHQATGKYSTAIGYLTKATGNYSFAGGSPNRVNWGNGSISYRIPQATGDTSFAFGWGNTIASGNYSVAMGYSCSATKEASFCFSHQGICMGNHSVAINTTPQVSHSNCLVGGYLCKSTNNEQFVFGKFNADNPSGVEYKMILGNGTSNTTALSKNIMTVDTEGNATFAGTVSSAGADYAEFFEWADGNTEAEDRVGYIVALDGDKIKFASSDDDVLGVISATATVLGDNAEWCWNKRYLTDDFGRTLYEEREVICEAIYNPDGELIQEEKTEVVNAPIVNPDYNPSQPYVNRRNRPEWGVVGMMGKLFVRDDGTAKVNGYVMANNGIATASKTKTNMRVMKRITDNIIQVCLK